MSQTQSSTKPQPSPRGATSLFSCGIFRNCTQSSSLTPHSSPPPSLSSPLPPPPHPLLTPSPPSLPPPPSSSSSSSSASQSFTQWRLPVHQQSPSPPIKPPPSCSTLSETYHAAEIQFGSGASLQALRLLERALTPDPSPPDPCPQKVMAGVVSTLLNVATARSAAKVLLALVLTEANRSSAIQAGAAEAAIEAIMTSGPAGATAERGLAALELLCTTTEGATAVRNHQLAAITLVRAVEIMVGRGRECAIGVLAAIYGNSNFEVPSEVARVVLGAMQGECSARGRRKGVKLLRVLQESGRLDLAWDGIGGGC